jgi:hypothetical protein
MALGVAEIKVEFYTKDYIKLVGTEADNACMKEADKLLKRSRQYIDSHAKHPTGKLASEIKLEKSKFIGGGWAVEAQGPNNYDRYYATFVELGSIRNPTPIPFLRNPLKANYKSILSAIKKAVE